MTHFIGRKKELGLLKELVHKKSASLITVKGRRRIGKSRLLEEFGKTFTHTYIFSGEPPYHGITAAAQRSAFVAQMERLLKIPGIKADDWGDIFWHVANACQKGNVLLVLDEISWMGSKDPEFLGKLKTAWDLHFKKNPNLILALCGSISSWIDKNILSHTGFMGRISLNLTLEELTLPECNEFWSAQKQNVSAYDKFKFLAVTGGVPRYLEELEPKYASEHNIKRLAFQKEGVLFHEFDQIFSDLFDQRHETYRAIVQCLAQGPKMQEDIFSALNIPKRGDFSAYLDDLCKAKFVSRDFTWHLKNGKESKLSHYRLSDNYLRFYLKYIFPNKKKIEKDQYIEKSLNLLPEWSNVMGLQFENLVLHNRKRLHTILDISPDNIICDNPYFQRKTSKQEGCQIDYLIQTKFGTLYLCEIKFSKEPIKKNIIPEIETKIKRLNVPRYCSVRPVLIHVNGVTDEVLEQDYFAHIIDFDKLLNV